MTTIHRTTRRRFSSKPTLLVSALIGAFTVTSVGQAQTPPPPYNNWVSGDIALDSSWSLPAGAPQVNDGTSANAIDLAGATLNAANNGGNTSVYFQNGLLIGSGPGLAGSLTASADAAAPQAGIDASTLLVGSGAGGTGTLTFNLQAPASNSFQGGFGTQNAFAVGDGAGSTGTLNILGAGKPTNSFGNSFSGQIGYSSTATVGSTGGTGTLNVNGSAAFLNQSTGYYAVSCWVWIAAI